MEYGTDLQRFQHCSDMVEVLFIDLSGFVFLAAEGLDLVNAGEIVLQLAVEFAHLRL